MNDRNGHCLSMRASGMTTKSKAGVSWNNVKAGLRGFDRTALLGLIQDLYAASKDNRAFLHARLNLGGDPLKP
jgi:hypothetical protein